MDQKELSLEFKKAAVEVARFFSIADVATWEELPEGIRGFMSVVDYKSLVKPLVYRDRAKLSWVQLSTKYGLTVQEVRTICTKVYFRATITKK